MTPTKLVHVIDDDPDVRDSVGFLLESSGFSVRTHESAEAFLAAAERCDAGCVLTDVRMPGMDGLTLMDQLAERRARLAVIVMTGNGDIPIAVQAMKAGAVDFLEKPFDEALLLAAVHRALAANAEQQAIEAAAAEAAARLASLTPREREVMGGLVAGRPNKVIAQELGASPRTIEVHRARVMEKLRVHSLPDLVRLVLAAEAARTSQV